MREGETQTNHLLESEINNHYFEVMVSNDGITWESAIVIAGFGNTLEQKKYSVHSLMTDYKYARLKQVDFDGTVNYHRVISLGEADADIRIIGDRLLINSKTSQEINVFDLSGRSILNTTVPKGPQLITLTSKGVLFVRVGSRTIRIIR